jgi:molybdate transport system ATP-binding protein
MADNIGVMDEGRLIDIQDKKDFFDNPETVVATRLTGCKNVSRVKKAKDNVYSCLDWGIDITIPDFYNANINFVGYRAHYFELVKNDEAINVFKCSMERIIEDTFSVMVCFRQTGNDCDSSDSLLTWVVSKPKWDEIKDEIGEVFYLKLNPDYLITLER